MSALAAQASQEGAAGYYPHGLVSLTQEHRMADTVKRLGKVRVEPLQASRFIRPSSIFFEMDGMERRWDMVQGVPSVGAILYHCDLKAVLLVRQFRPPVYVACAAEAAAEGRPAPPLTAGFTYELCAGLEDKSKSREQIVKEEILEECGYDVPVDSIRFVTSYVAASGSMGARQRVFAAEVDDSQLVMPGGGVKGDGEAIEVLALPLSGTQRFMEDDSLAKSAALPLAFLWVQHQLQQNGGRLFRS
ncbi:hypothetical protein N2152v2_003217 [Parachlorella kessleri]